MVGGLCCLWHGMIRVGPLLLLLTVLSTPTPGHALDARASAQGWILRIETHHDESDTYALRAHSGLHFLLEFGRPVLLGGAPWPVTPSHGTTVADAIVLKRHHEVIEWSEAGVESGQPYVLFPVVNECTHEVERWISVLSDEVAPHSDRLSLLLVFDSNKTSAAYMVPEYEYTLTMQECGGSTAQCFTYVDGSPVSGNITFQPTSPAFVSFDVVDRQMEYFDPVPNDKKTDAAQSMGTGVQLHPKDSMRLTSREHLMKPHERDPPEGPPPVAIGNASPHLNDPQVQDRLAVTFDSFIDLSKKETPSDMDKAVAQGWKLAHDFHRGEVSEASFVDIRDTMQTEHAAGISTGFILFAVIEGFAPKAVKQGYDKMEQLMKKYLVPFLSDLLNGNPNDARPKPQHGGKRRLLSEENDGHDTEAVSAAAAAARIEEELTNGDETVLLQTGVKAMKKGGPSGIAKDYGLLSIAITTDLLWATPAIVDAISTPFTTLAAQQIFSSVIETVRAPIEREIPTAVGNMVKKTVPMTVSYVIPIAIKRLLPGYVLQALANTVTNVLTRALTHSLADTLQHTLTRDSNLEIACYKCKYMQTHCETCFDGKDQHRQFTAGYYSNYYASFYSDYYGYYFTRGEGVLRDDHPHLFKFIEEFVGVKPYPYKHEHKEYDHEPNWYTGMRMDQ